MFRSYSLARLTVPVVLTATFATGQTPIGGHFTPPSHVIVVMEENHSYSEIIGSPDAPYINSLANAGASFTNSYAISHPSEPNYLDLFSGMNQGVTDDSCPHTFSTQNLESELITAKRTFVSYSEGLPSTGSEVCTAGEYARKHNPWTNFSNDPAALNQPFTSFPTNYATLPTVSWIIPDLLDDMHDGTVQEGDSWLQTNLSAYAQWAQTHNSLLIVTWDEDDDNHNNQIATIFVGQVVKPGHYSEMINHYNVLRTLEDMYGLPHLANTKTVKPITDVWK